MNTGQYISGAAHGGLILWALLGGIFVRPNDIAMPSQEVSLISGAEFAALTAPREAPEVTTTPPAPQPPASDPTPQTPTPDAPAPTPVPVPEPTPAPEAETVPAVPQALPTPVDPAIPESPAEPSFEEQGANAPAIPNREPTPRPVNRVAPEAVINPEPTPEIADTAQAEVAPDAQAPVETVKPEQAAAAPEEATTEIVTEAETPNGMASSPRPQSRPPSIARAAQAAKEAAEAAAQAAATPDEPAPQTPATPAPATPAPAAEPDSVADDVFAAIAAAQGETAAAPTTRTGPPMTSGERDALRVAVAQCWNVGAMSSEAMRTVITVEVKMSQDGKPDAGSIRLIGQQGGDNAAAQAGFEVARRAIIRCGANGFNLPVEKYDQWRTIEMTFDPEQMRYK
ncbi:hypothetical protein AQS8620_01096 [Aquimixticola soesokkakensis]|uniref:Cell division and transport-associated protein TolA n=1 Tax=Aquimixticola soesokkakensis TaxID=1519096 RepID=A0A1Y5S9J4_9RHOB|nr:hypothetical protein [Aquimixticola soesokkakensis]SLN32767.1 hypothetical protein AQS8620_01096 [Aquimixticola soesokkakensis]